MSVPAIKTSYTSSQITPLILELFHFDFKYYLSIMTVSNFPLFLLFEILCSQIVFSYIDGML